MAEWDILTDAGVTALGVAAMRAIESRRPDGLVTDPYAEAFVRAARAPMPIPVTSEEAASDTGIPWLPMTTYTGLRSKFFDGFLTAAAGAGIRQAVILAAGLDSRAFRLEWPQGTTVYEADAPLVLGFKDRVLAEQGARPRCERRTVPTDLREEWPAALRRAGFDPSERTAWIAEGLLGYLTDDAKDALLTRVHDLSAPGSQAALEHLGTDIAELADDPAMREVSNRVDFDFTGLWPADQRHDPAGWLARHGWDTSIDPITAIADRYQRSLDGLVPAMRSVLLITASLSQPRPAGG
jgi:methyltransferase (TIGR00027 family)